MISPEITGSKALYSYGRSGRVCFEQRESAGRKLNRDEEKQQASDEADSYQRGVSLTIVCIGSFVSLDKSRMKTSRCTN